MSLVLGKFSRIDRRTSAFFSGAAVIIARSLMEPRMITLCNRPNGLRFAVLALLVPLSVDPVHADNALSDRLTNQILQLHKLDITRRIESEFERRTQSLGEQDTVERANGLRNLLKDRATAYELLEDFSRAEADFNARVDLKPPPPSVYSDRGYFYMRQSRFSEAVRDFIAGSRLAPSEARFSYGAGRAFSRMGQYAEAVVQYGEAIRLAPNDSDMILSRAEALTQLGQYSQARNDYDLALRLGLTRPADRFSAFFGRGYASIFLGDFGGTVSDMNLALALRPDMLNAVVWRGYAQERLGQRERALADYEAALRISPNDGWINASIRRMRS
jgi:tetratricopeptide (TPR) repeat protein